MIFNFIKILEKEIKEIKKLNDSEITKLINEINAVEGITLEERIMYYASITRTLTEDEEGRFSFLKGLRRRRLKIIQKKYNVIFEGFEDEDEEEYESDKLYIFSIHGVEHIIEGNMKDVHKPLKFFKKPFKTMFQFRFENDLQYIDTADVDVWDEVYAFWEENVAYLDVIAYTKDNGDKVKDVEKFPIDPVKKFGEFLFTKVVPKERSLWNLIYFKHLIWYMTYSYKSNRLVMGFPIYSQRTRTNAKTARKNYFNNTLKKVLLYRGYKYYGNLPKTEIETAIKAEYINLLYKLNFPKIWLAAFKHSQHSIKTAKPKKGKIVKIDLYSLANSQVMYPAKFSKLTKKQKKTFKTNYLTLGFVVGFTKNLMKDLLKARKDPTYLAKSGSMLVFRKTEVEQPGKRKKGKKKQTLKQKKLAHLKKKKSKKSVWD